MAKRDRSRAVRDAIDDLPTLPATNDPIARFVVPPAGSVYTQVKITAPQTLGAAVEAILAECQHALADDAAAQTAALQRIAQLCLLLGYDAIPSDFFGRAHRARAADAAAPLNPAAAPSADEPSA